MRRKKHRVASMDSKRMRDRSRLFDKGKFNDEFNNPCFFRRAKGKTLTENVIIACSSYIYTHACSYNLLDCY